MGNLINLVCSKFQLIIILLYFGIVLFVKVNWVGARAHRNVRKVCSPPI